MNNLDKQYQNLLTDILENGIEKKDRTNTGTLSVFGRQIRHKMSDGFPLLTTKKMAFKSIVTELLWFLKGDTNIKYLVDNGCNIWNGDAYKNYIFNSEWFPISSVNGGFIGTKTGSDEIMTQTIFINKIKTDDEFAKKWGDLGKIYGHQWRRWGARKNINQTGFLHKTNEGWAVKWSDLHSFAQGTEWMITPIDIHQQHLYRDEDEGRRVNFKRIVNDFADFVAHVLVVDNQYTYVDGIDQIQNLINELKTNPDSRRLMVNSWNLSELQDMVLPPCHYSFQVYTRELSYNERYEIHRKYITEDKLDLVLEFATNENLDKLGVPTRTISLMWNQRSIDTFLGLPFNIASYGLLLEIIAYELGMVPDELIGNLGDTHLYLNHIEQAKEQISRQPYSLPTLSFTDEVNYMMDTNLDYPGNSLSFSDKIEQFRPDMFIVQDYQSYPAIKAPLSN